MTNSAPETAALGLVEALARANTQPLWENYRRLNSREPHAADPPIQWQWAELQPLIERAAREVRMPEAERRVLLLTNPAFGGEAITTTNIIGALQILEPGESAPPHRHTAAALRLVIEAEGGTTFVDGTPLEMREGDFILTPGWTWHNHANDTDRRIVWFDGLDVTLLRHSLDAMFFEPRPPEGAIEACLSPIAPWRWTESGLAPAEEAPESPPHSPKLRYPWQMTRETLDAMPARRDGSRALRFVNPQTGGAVMPTLDCSVLRLEGKAETAPRRSTANAICVVIDGEGGSTVGEKSFAWKKHDIFTIPHWCWASHRALSPRAHLFFFTDRELFRRLSLLREEVAH